MSGGIWLRGRLACCHPGCNISVDVDVEMTISPLALSTPHLHVREDRLPDHWTGASFAPLCPNHPIKWKTP